MQVKKDPESAYAHTSIHFPPVLSPTGIGEYFFFGEKHN